jgi:hypothetical protein
MTQAWKLGVRSQQEECTKKIMIRLDLIFNSNQWQEYLDHIKQKTWQWDQWENTLA